LKGVFSLLNFEFLIPTNIIFGRDTEQFVGEQIKPFGKKVLLHYGGGSIKKSGLYDRIVASLKKSGLEYIELGGVQPNPRLSLVRKGIELCRENGVDFILAAGGGSVIDSSKAIGIGVPYEGDVWDFFTGTPVTKTLPVGSVLTIPAAGSECSLGAVITNEDGFYKRSAGHQMMRPKFAILNPELSFTLPPYQTACGITDMIAHVLERYFTTTENVDLTDRFCEATIRTIVKNAPIVLRNPNDYNARAEIMWAAPSPTPTFYPSEEAATGHHTKWNMN
jgi:alcohol dehydrogenase YqhD (iron-dependent ADH family)